MIELSFSPHVELEILNKADRENVSALSDDMFRYGSFHAGVTFRVNGALLLSGDGKDPLVDFISNLASTIRTIEAGERCAFEIFSSDHWLTFTPSGERVNVEDSYGSGSWCLKGDLLASSRAFILDVILYIGEKYPELANRELLKEIELAIGEASS
ncbi:hypothetical protein ACWDR0_30040 [Streptomyces sp. NPDC003691]